MPRSEPCDLMVAGGCRESDFALEPVACDLLEV